MAPNVDADFDTLVADWGSLTEPATAVGKSTPPLNVVYRLHQRFDGDSPRASQIIEGQAGIVYRRVVVLVRY